MKKIVQSIREKFRSAGNKVVVAMTETKGEIATSTIGGIIVGVVIVGLLIVAINQYFPSFFSDMFSKMSTKLNANW